MEQLMTAHNHRAVGTGQNEWYTPEKYLEAARTVLGEFDLDPASSKIANASVKAKKIHTIEDDGLTKKWKGKIWLNPPYSQPQIAQFTEKLVSEYLAGHVSEAIALTHNYTDTRWFQHLARHCSAICFTKGRVGFLDPVGKKAAPTQGQAFFYLGDNAQGFQAVFSAVGLVLLTFSPREDKNQPCET